MKKNIHSVLNTHLDWSHLPYLVMQTSSGYNFHWKQKHACLPYKAFFLSLVSLYPTITFCLRWLDEEFVLIGLVSPSTCHSTMAGVCKKEHLFKVSKSPLAVLKLHFINSEEQLTMMLVTCLRQIHQRRGESMLACGWQWDYKRMNSKRKLLRFD